MQATYNVNVVYWTWGAITMLMSVYLAFGIKEQYKPKEKVLTGAFKQTMRQYLTQLNAQKSVIVAYVSNFATTATTISTYQYGYIIWKEQYNPDEQT